MAITIGTNLHYHLLQFRPSLLRHPVYRTTAIRDFAEGKQSQLNSFDFTSIITLRILKYLLRMETWTHQRIEIVSTKSIRNAVYMRRRNEHYSTIVDFRHNGKWNGK